MSKFILPALLALLAGCATPTIEQRSAQMQSEVDQMVQVYGPACEKLGYKPGEDAWRECILKLNTSKTIESYSTRRATTECFGHRGFFQCSSF